MMILFPLAILLGCTLTNAAPSPNPNDTLGVANGYSTFSTTNFDIKLVTQSQTLASIRAKGHSFDFSPFDYMPFRARNGQYHLGDITYRYRVDGDANWTFGDSAAVRAPVTKVNNGTVLAASDMGPTLPKSNQLGVTRIWRELSGDLALEFKLTNTGNKAMEIGSLGFPIEFNSIFTNRTAEETQAKCSLHDPYIGLDAGYLRVTPVSGIGPVLVVTPLDGTPFEAWRNLNETSYPDTQYGSQTFEGFYEWQTNTLAYAQKEWVNVTPWNPPTSRKLAVGQSITVGLRFSLSLNGTTGIDGAIRKTGVPVARGVPGYIIPQDLAPQLFLFADSDPVSFDTDPVESFAFGNGAQKNEYLLQPGPDRWGRVRLTVTYADGKVQTVHYYITKPGPTALADLGKFSTTAQWFNDASDPFGRAPSVMTYDREANAIVTQDSRVWIAGLSDEAGAGSYLAAVMKQAAQPNADEVAKLEAFVNQVLWGRIQNKNFTVKKSIFYYDRKAQPNYPYRADIDWTSWTSWDKDAAYAIDRAYDYIHVIAAYWALYRVGRAYPDLLAKQKWDWYLSQAYNTVFACFQKDADGNYLRSYADVGLMEETVIWELLQDLKREGKKYTDAAANISNEMAERAARWNTEAVPFGSEMAWDSTGQEGVYLWSREFGYNATATKALNTVLGFMPTVPHWGWNGNARRYWDNIYGGKLRRIERQLHHYGSGLNSLVLLSQYRLDPSPSNSYILRTGYGGMNGPLSNIDQEGFSSASFHSFPDTLKWDAYSGDYGPNHLGLILGSACYIAQDDVLGLVAYGGQMTDDGGVVRVEIRDAVRRRVYIGPLGLLVEVDAGVIQEVAFKLSTRLVNVTLGQLPNVPVAKTATMWLTTETGDKGVNSSYVVTMKGVKKNRAGWAVPLSKEAVTVRVGNGCYNGVVGGQCT